MSDYLPNGLLRSVTPWSAEEELARQAAAPKGLYTRDEISRMTDDALDELLSYYGDTGNTEGTERVQDELAVREQDRQDELAYYAEQDRQQQLHDEMINDALAQDGRWG